MSIPTAVSVPGAELVLRIRKLAPRPETQIIVNCAGRTRSIIGTQSLINAGIPNPVAALRNGTIGWKLAHQELTHGALDQFDEVDETTRTLAARDSRLVADRAGVSRLSRQALITLSNSQGGTWYRFDVRTPEEFIAGHIPDFLNAPGGQLVQETDMFAPVRGANIVLVDDDGTRANMTASWLAQMGWRVSVIDGLSPSDFSATGPSNKTIPASSPVPDSAFLSATDLYDRYSEVSSGSLIVLDLAKAAQYSREHIAGSWYALRSDLQAALDNTPSAASYVLTSPDGVLARFAFNDIRGLTTKPVYLLRGGTLAWQAMGLPLSSNDTRFASVPIDRYQRPYEGNEAPASAIQAYLDWEYGLVEQLGRDGTHGFFVI
jgi:rhodanese-related sulfurtransferase